MQSNKQDAKSLTMAVFSTYLCSSIVMNLPILLLPMAAAEHAITTLTMDMVSSLVMSIPSIAIMGSALGKFVNGFVCRELGAQRSSAIYLLLGSALCCLLFSYSPHNTTMTMTTVLKWACAGMEFVASMQWTALSVVLA